MRWLYTIFIRFYGLAARFVAFCSAKAKAFVQGRRNFPVPPVQDEKPWFWFHAASLGEFEQGRPVIEEVRARFPEIKILLSFFSPSGYEIRKDYELADQVIYMPLDTVANARKLLKNYQIKAAFFIKYEFWFNHLKVLQHKGIPVFYFSVRFRDNQHFFKPYGFWFRKHLNYVEHFFVQDEHSAELLKSIGINQYSIAGDTRFDRVAKIAAKADPIPEIEQFIGGRKCIIAGSTWPPDEVFLVEMLSEMPDDYCLIFAPHDVSESHIAQLKNRLNVSSGLFSKKQFDPANKVLIIDQIGLLSRTYRYARFAYIGGGFGKAIHNIQEAVTFGCPVIFGPKHEQFTEAVDLLGLGGAFSVNNAQDLKTRFDQLIHDEAFYLQASAVCKDYVHKQLGATSKIMSFLDNRFEEE
ncbi:MAG: 3-deoxy-D-manno-octulosonic acid transferase [Bacteroidales bacterium]|nr:3-deoxy-D-manno-octulosonic acid transferase [Bacteroidales bacterium]